jgi:glycosyltransferase involved in cell wall biosynthesis
MNRKKLISIVIPVFNEALNIEACHAALQTFSSQLADRYDFEFIFTDNHSDDDTWILLKKIAAQDTRVRAFSFSKNFGYQRSIFTGLMKAKGAAVIAFDCDLQDPIELIETFLTQWEAGYSVVYGIRTKRKEPKFLELSRKVFYRLINFISEDPLPVDAGDFRLLDRRIINLLSQMKEQQPYLRGIIASLGFKQMGIPYERRERTAGRSKFNLRKLVGLSVDGIISQSVVPLRIATFFGATIALLAILLLLLYLGLKIFHVVQWPRGFTTTTVLILVSMAINGLFLGILGEYIARIFKQLQGRPFVIIEKSTSEEQPEIYGF